ncbi:MAG: hypothetical protein J6S45_07185 [Firmicutes bacterium]|nr:hypothetical protein [Bacillota bacterium]
MYILYDVMEILRQVVQLLILIGCGVGVMYLILVLRDLQKFLNRAADLGIDAMVKLNKEIDQLDGMLEEEPLALEETKTVE